MMVDYEHIQSCSATGGNGSFERRQRIENGEHCLRLANFRGILNSENFTCGGRGGEWGGNGFSPNAVLSNFGDALKCAVNSIRADVALQTTNARDQLLRSCRGLDEAGVRRSSCRRRRVVASISLSQTAGSDKSGAGAVHDSPRISPISESATDSSTPPQKKARGWFSEVGQARAFYRQISVVDRARIGAMAGGLAGGFTYCCLHPIDTVRTKLQTRGAADVYKNGFQVVVSILKTKGILGFYSGISAVLVGSILSSAVYFGCIELGRSALVKFTPVTPLLIPPLSGAFGNIVSSTILVPKEVITQRMQAGASGRSWHLALRTVQNEGIRGLYAGYYAALVRNLPSSVLSFTAFEYVKAAWLKNSGKTSLEPWQSVISGALAGAISGALTTPLDVVKTRLMTQMKKEVMGTVAEGTAAAELRAKIAASSYRGISSTLKQIWVEEGWIGLTKGMGPRLLHSAMFSALGYFAFETARVKLVKRHMAKLKRTEAGSQQPAGIIL